MKRSWLVMMPLVIALSACGNQNHSSKSANIDDKIKSGKEVASLGGVTLHEGFVDLLKQVNPNLGAQANKPAGKKRIVDNLLEQEVLYQESVKRGITNLPQYQQKAALYQRVIFAQGLVEEEANKKAKEYYDKNKDKEFNEVQLSHILIRVAPEVKPGEPTPPAPEGEKLLTDAEASAKAGEAKKKIDAGTKWEDAVNEFSDDRFSKTRGGDLGKVNREDRRAERLEWKGLIDKAFTMKAGEVSEPIKAKDGYHIIKVVEAAKVAPFEDVQSRIKFKVQPEVKKELLSALTKDEKPKYLDEELKNIPQEETPGLPIPMNPQGGVKPGAMPTPPNAPAAPVPTGAPEVKKPEEAVKPAEAPKVEAPKKEAAPAEAKKPADAHAH